MLQYLIILLDDTSTSYCHYNNERTERKLISLEDLKAGIFFGMKENLMIQYVYPSHELPAEYSEVLESIDHSKIMPTAMWRKLMWWCLTIGSKLMVLALMPTLHTCFESVKPIYLTIRNW